MAKKEKRSPEKKQTAINEKQKKLLSILLPAFLIIFIFLITLFNISGDDDVFWHMETGRYITENKSIPSTDVFGLTTSANEWIPFEWGFDVLIYNFYSISGYTGISIFRSLLFSGLFLLLYLAAYRMKLDTGIAGLILLLLCFGMFERFLIKPQIISYFFTSVLLYIFTCYSFCGRNKLKMMYAVPLIFLLWANMHMGVLLGIVLFTVFILSEYIQYKKPAFNTVPDNPVTAGSFKILILLYAASLLALLVNPHGYNTYLYVYSHMNMKMIDEVFEWYSPFNSYFSGTIFIYSYYIFITLTLLGIFNAYKKKLIFPLIALPVFLLFSFRAVRYSIDFMLIVSLLLILVFSYSAKLSNISSFFRKPFLAYTALLLLAAGIILTPGNNLYKMFNYDRTFGSQVDKNSYPVDAFKFIKDNGIARGDSRVFNTFDIGGYLIWELKGTKNFIDSRNLNDDIYYTYKHLNGKQPGFEEKFRNYNFDLIVWHYDKLPWNNGEMRTSILSYLIKNTNYNLVYWDDDSFVFVKNDPKYKELIDKFEYKYANPYYYIVEKEPLKQGLSSDPIRVTEEIKRKLAQEPNGVFIQAMAKSFNVKQ